MGCCLGARVCASLCACTCACARCRTSTNTSTHTTTTTTTTHLLNERSGSACQQKKLQVPRELVARPTPRPPPRRRRPLKPRRHHSRHRGCGTRHLASLRPPTFPVVCCSVFVFASVFCLSVSTQGFGVLRSLLPVSSSEQAIDGPGSQPIDTTGPHSVCKPCSRAHFDRATTACVSSPTRLGGLHALAHAARHGYF